MNIRTAERRDLSAMLDIYNYEVKNGTATFDVEPRAGAAGEAWFAAHNTGNHPLLVAEEDGKVLGYASLSPYRDFDAYLQTVDARRVCEQYRKNRYNCQEHRTCKVQSV